jgi:hypothetical protein
MGKSISHQILEKWIELNTEFLEEKGKLMVHEFLYLMVNAQDRKEMIQKIPKVPLNPRMDKKVVSKRDC